jgi:tetratricopeptide (TPR) repeat protein
MIRIIGRTTDAEREGRSRGIMQTAAELIEMGQQARNAGRTEEALALYERAVAAFEAEGDLVRAAHTRRHSADLQREMGRIEEARRSIGAVTAFYRAHGTGTLELGNTLRIAALVEAADGRDEEARVLWMETLELYEEVGVAAGVAECRRRLA